MGRKKKPMTLYALRRHHQAGKWPFGRACDYLEHADSNKHEDWYPTFEFTATMRVEGLVKKGGGVVRLSNNKGKNVYHMFVGDVMDMMQRAKIEAGVVRGTWTFRRQGEYYGLRWVR